MNESDNLTICLFYAFTKTRTHSFFWFF